MKSTSTRDGRARLAMRPVGFDTFHRTCRNARPASFVIPRARRTSAADQRVTRRFKQVFEKVDSGPVPRGVRRAVECCSLEKFLQHRRRQTAYGAM